MLLRRRQHLPARRFARTESSAASCCLSSDGSPRDAWEAALGDLHDAEAALHEAMNREGIAGLVVGGKLIMNPNATVDRGWPLLDGFDRLEVYDARRQPADGLPLPGHGTRVVTSGLRDRRNPLFDPGGVG
jgi:hypothetical protein